MFDNDLPLSNLDINKYYKKNKHYKGCHSLHSNHLPTIRNNQFIILNLDYTENEGTHWVLLYRKKNSMFYFDSFGVKYGQSILNYFKRYNTINSVIYQNEDLQLLDSSKCGYFCLFVADMMNKKHSFKKIINSFTQDGSIHNVELLKTHFQKKEGTAQQQ